MEKSCQLQAPADFSPGEETRYWIEGWVDPTTGLVTVESRKIPSPCRQPKPTTPIVQPIG